MENSLDVDDHEEVPFPSEVLFCLPLPTKNLQPQRHSCTANWELLLPFPGPVSWRTTILFGFIFLPEAKILSMELWIPRGLHAYHPQLFSGYWLYERYCASHWGRHAQTTYVPWNGLHLTCYLIER